MLTKYLGISYKTSLGGIGMILTAVAGILDHLSKGTPIDYLATLSLIVGGISLLFAKDKQVTGGNIMQPTPPVIQAQQKVETVDQAKEVNEIQKTGGWT